MDDELLRSSPLSSFLDGADDERAGVGGGWTELRLLGAQAWKQEAHV